MTDFEQRIRMRAAHARHWLLLLSGKGDDRQIVFLFWWTLDLCPQDLGINFPIQNPEFNFYDFSGQRDVKHRELSRSCLHVRHNANTT